MNRGVLIIGVVGIVVALANAIASGIIAALYCFDSCTSVITIVSYSPQTLLLALLIVSPALSLIAVAWIWELLTLRQLRARGTLIFVALFPLITLVAVIAVTMIAALKHSAAPLAFTPLDLWSGAFALALWPLLVSIIAFIQRRRGQSTPPLQRAS